MRSRICILLIELSLGHTVTGMRSLTSLGGNWRAVGFRLQVGTYGRSSMGVTSGGGGGAGRATASWAGAGSVSCTALTWLLKPEDAFLGFSGQYWMTRSSAVVRVSVPMPGISTVTTACAHKSSETPGLLVAIKPALRPQIDSRAEIPGQKAGPGAIFASYFLTVESCNYRVIYSRHLPWAMLSPQSPNGSSTEASSVDFCEVAL